MTTHQHPTPTPESDEAYVREVLDSAMTGTRPPHDLSGAAIARGRRMRTRRRLTVVTTVAAAGALVAVAGPWLVGGPDGADSRGSDLVATQPPAPERARPDGWWDMPATDMVSAVEAILPDGVTVTDPGPLEADSPEGGPAVGAIVPRLTAPAGPGSLNVILYPPVDPDLVVDGTGTAVAPEGECDDPELAEATSCFEVSPGEEAQVVQTGPATDVGCGGEWTGHTTCAEIRDQAGTLVGRRLTNRSGGTISTEVVLRREDGGTVYASSANTLDAKWGPDSPVSAARPPLSLDQLEDLVRNDVWVTGPGT